MRHRGLDADLQTVMSGRKGERERGGEGERERMSFGCFPSLTVAALKESYVDGRSGINPSKRRQIPRSCILVEL